MVTGLGVRVPLLPPSEGGIFLSKLFLFSNNTGLPVVVVVVVGLAHCLGVELPEPELVPAAVLVANSAPVLLVDAPFDAVLMIFSTAANAARFAGSALSPTTTLCPPPSW